MMCSLCTRRRQRKPRHSQTSRPYGHTRSRRHPLLPPANDKQMTGAKCFHGSHAHLPFLHPTTIVTMICLACMYCFLMYTFPPPNKHQFVCVCVCVFVCVWCVCVRVGGLAVTLQFRSCMSILKFDKMVCVSSADLLSRRPGRKV
jgi:hypothetical protein